MRLKLRYISLALVSLIFISTSVYGLVEIGLDKSEKGISTPSFTPSVSTLNSYFFTAWLNRDRDEIRGAIIDAMTGNILKRLVIDKDVLNIRALVSGRKTYLITYEKRNSQAGDPDVYAAIVGYDGSFIKLLKISTEQNILEVYPYAAWDSYTRKYLLVYYIDKKMILHGVFIYEDGSIEYLKWYIETETDVKSVSFRVVGGNGYFVIVYTYQSKNQLDLLYTVVNAKTGERVYDGILSKDPEMNEVVENCFGGICFKEYYYIPFNGYSTLSSERILFLGRITLGEEKGKVWSISKYGVHPHLVDVGEKFLLTWIDYMDDKEGNVYACLIDPINGPGKIIDIGGDEHSEYAEKNVFAAYSPSIKNQEEEFYVLSWSRRKEDYDIYTRTINVIGHLGDLTSLSKIPKNNQYVEGIAVNTLHKTFLVIDLRDDEHVIFALFGVLGEDIPPPVPELWLIPLLIILLIIIVLYKYGDKHRTN